LRLPLTLERFDRALVIRHFAITAAAVLAYLLRIELSVGNGSLWILGSAAAMNFAAFSSAKKPGLHLLAMRASPFLAVACWAALANLTGGVASPFAAGFWLEIVLAATSSSLALVSLVSLSTVLALWGQQALIGMAGAWMSIFVSTGFLLLVGSVSVLMTRRSLRAQREHASLQYGLERRLKDLEKELDEVRLVGEVGENAAQLAHGLKNAVHSLRGFTELIQPKGETVEVRGAALEGLRVAIDRLEDLARGSLLPPGRAGAPVSACGGEEAGKTIDEVAGLMSASYPEISWERQAEAALPPARTSSTVLREILFILLQNAAEAMEGRGRVRIETQSSGDAIWIRVRDQGCGIPRESMQRIFDPGFTTKQGGSGFGLYCARKLIEAHGGRLAAEAAPGGGALFSLAIPRGEA